MKYMLSQHPVIAERWVREHKQKFSDLPKKIKRQKKAKIS